MIECVELCKNYAQTSVLDHINLTIEAGGPIGVVGPNGSGKTTFFSTLSGFLKPTSGTVRIFGCSPNDPKLKRKFSVLPQDCLFPKATTVIDSLTFFSRLSGYSPSKAKKEAEKVLALVDLSQTAGIYPDKLSHGMKKRLSIAQAFIGAPPLTLLDEPTAGLDPANAANIRSLIKSRSKNTTFLISSHNLQEIENLCSSILILGKGKLVKHDHMENVVSRHSVLSIVLEMEPDTAVLNMLKNIDGVEDVQLNSGDNLVIRYNETRGDQIQIDVIQCLISQSVTYREIKKGQSLEQEMVNLTRKS